jgi:hypothetical protein
VSAIPVATYLAGSLLSLLLPTLMLIALVVWYVKFIRHVPETTTNGPGAGPPGTTSDQAPGMTAADGRESGVQPMSTRPEPGASSEPGRPPGAG